MHRTRWVSQQKQHPCRAAPRSASVLLAALPIAPLLLESRGTVMVHRAALCEVQSIISDNWACGCGGVSCALCCVKQTYPYFVLKGYLHLYSSQNMSPIQFLKHRRETIILWVLHTTNEGLQKLTEASVGKCWCSKRITPTLSWCWRGLTCYVVHWNILFTTTGPFNRVAAVPDDKVE